MYSRNYGNYGMLPPGYSGVAMRGAGDGRAEAIEFSPNPSDLPCHPRRPTFEDCQTCRSCLGRTLGKASGEVCEGPLERSFEHSSNHSPGRPSERPFEKDEKSKKGGYTYSQSGMKNDDILLAGLIVLLMSEGKCDALTLLSLAFLLLS